MTTSITDFTWKPDLNDGQALFFEALHGFKGYLRIGDQLFRVLILPADVTLESGRIVLDLAGEAPGGTRITGRFMQNPDEDACLRQTRPAPILQGHFSIQDEAMRHFELVAWLRISKAGGRYIGGLISTVTNTDS